MAGEIKYTPEFFLEREEFWLDTERPAFELRVQGKSWPEISEILGTCKHKLNAKAKNLAARAAKRGFSPDHDMVKTVPDGFRVRGVSTMYDHEGKQRAQWVKSASDHERQKEIMLERIEKAFQSDRKPFKPTPAPKKADGDLLNLVTITDFHIGMLAWGDETGSDWDTDMAADVFLNAIADMLRVLPKAGTGMLAQLGDFLHFDGLASITPTSGHLLDSDTRYSRLVDITIRIMEEAIRMMLKHHDHVIVLQAEGNHDESGSVWLRKHCKHVYRDDPRVTVDDTEFPYYAHLFGENLIAFHHGHKKKLKDLPKLFASEPRYRKLWGAATRTYAHCGHYHSEVLVEDGGAIVRQHPTLSSRDAYATRGGWVSEAKAKGIVYHKTDGEIAEYTVRPRTS